MASRAIQELTDSLPDGALIVDADVAAAYSRDRTDVLAAGAPLAVVPARSTDAVARAMAWAHAHDVPVVTGGAGTGLSGGATATPGCVVVSLAKMNRILPIEPDDFVARGEAGVINGDLDRTARPRGLMDTPDPSDLDISTIGGNIATQAVPGLDLVGLFCGSEGTLGVITETVIALAPTPPETRSRCWPPSPPPMRSSARCRRPCAWAPARS